MQRCDTCKQERSPEQFEKYRFGRLVVGTSCKVCRYGIAKSPRKEAIENPRWLADSGDVGSKWSALMSRMKPQV